MIDGIAVDVDAEAVVVRSATPLATVSSAILGGGQGRARTVVNLHVPRSFPCETSLDALEAFARRRALARPLVGLLTAAWTAEAEVAEETCDGLAACVIATVGLSNATGAGRAPSVAWTPSTINTIVLVDADPEPAAMVNLVATVTEVKALALGAAGVRAADGGPASGTSSDAVVVAATGRGRGCRFGGPASELGALAARAARTALEAGVRRWLAGRT